MTDLFQILANQGQGDGTSMLITFALILVMGYFLLIRPQKKQRQEQEARIAALSKGDKVVTIGGMHGIVHHISKDTVTLKISEGVFVPFDKVAISKTASSEKSQKKDKEEPKEASEETSKG